MLLLWLFSNLYGLRFMHGVEVLLQISATRFYAFMGQIILHPTVERVSATTTTLAEAVIERLLLTYVLCHIPTPLDPRRWSAIFKQSLTPTPPAPLPPAP